MNAIISIEAATQHFKPRMVMQCQIEPYDLPQGVDIFYYLQSCILIILLVCEKLPVINL